MKSKLFVFSAVLFSVLFLTACSKDEEIEKPVLPDTLTVKEVILGDKMVLKSIAVSDEKGNEIPFSNNPNNWFENAVLESMTIPVGAILSLVFDPATSSLVTKLASWSKCNFAVEGKSYLIGVGPGSKFVVQKTKTGKYSLLPDETVQLSSAP